MFLILIIEDDLILGRSLEKSLNSIEQEVKVFIAGNKSDAMKILYKNAIDVFIIDINLPDGNGISLAKKIRKIYRYHPIIIESAETNSTYQTKVYDEVEAFAYLPKPFSMSKIIDKVEKALEIASNLSAKVLIIEQNSFKRYYKLRDIIFVETVKNKKRIDIFSYNQAEKCVQIEQFYGYTLYKILELSDFKLFRCHKSYLVNPQMIYQIDYSNNLICLEYTTEKIPIGKTYKSDISSIIGGTI